MVAQDPLSEEELEEAPQRRVRGESISSMSQLLLQGWAMLANCCPQCGCPLMRHPGGQQVLCVNCGSDSATAEPAGSAPAPPATAGDASEGDSATAGASSLQRLPNGTADGHASGSEEEGEEELLQPPSPLASRLRQAAAATAGPPTSQLGGTARAASAAAGSSAHRPGEEDASKRIAELMLEGWAMLQDHCPRCTNPLLRSRDGRMYCAGCQMYAVREGEAPPRQEHPTAASLQRTGGADSEPAAVARVPQAAVSAQAAQAGPRAASAAVAAGTAAQATPVFAGMRQHLTTLEAAAAAVAEQLAGATAALRDAAGAGQAAPLLVHMQQCAQALQALSDCGRSLAALQ